MQKNNVRNWLVSPLFIFSLIWIMQIVGQIYFSDSFNPFSRTTYYIVALGIFAFLIGCFIASLREMEYLNVVQPDDKIKLTLLKHVYYLLIPLYLWLALYPSLQLLIHSHFSISTMRENIVTTIINGDRSLHLVIYLNYTIVLFAIFFSCYAKILSKEFLYIVLSLGFFAGLSTLGRNILLLLFSSITVSLYLQEKIKLRNIIIISAVFTTIFFAIAILLNKGDSTNGIKDMIAWNSKVYFFNGLACFNNFIQNNSPQIEGNILIPNLIRHIVSVFGVHFPDAPILYPFVKTPLSGNVYTAFFPWYHDGGAIGVFFGFFLMGFITHLLYRKRNFSATHMYFYILSIYPIIMTIFDEQFLRAYPLWILAAAIPSTALLYGKLITRLEKTGQVK